MRAQDIKTILNVARTRSLALSAKQKSHQDYITVHKDHDYFRVTERLDNVKINPNRTTLERSVKKLQTNKPLICCDLDYGYKNVFVANRSFSVP